MISFDEFVEKAKAVISERIPGAEIGTQSVEKLQGESYTGISVRPEGSMAAAVFNPEPAYKSLREDPLRESEILGTLADEAEKAISSIPVINTERLIDYETMKDHLIMEVVPVEPNQEMLETVPHKTIEDIAVVYRIMISSDDEGRGTILITNKLLDSFGVSPEELHQAAVASQMKVNPPTLRNMSEVMASMSGGMIDVPDSPMWVATVADGVNGASVVQLPEFMEQAAEKLGGNFFVLPSSIHECLFVPDDGNFDRSELEYMVRSVNENEVSEADYLSDSVYHYDSEAKVFEKAETFESRVAEEIEPYDAEPLRETISVLLVEPEKHPRQVEIGTDLESLQKAVGGFIETVYPFDDDVCLVVNEEGKIDGMPLNRALRDEDGEIQDIIAGPFLVVGLTEESFGSLSPELMTKYEEEFHSPEVFLRMGKGILAMPVSDEAMDLRKTENTVKPKTKEESL